MSRAQHWNKIYDSKESDEVSWFAPHLATSINLIESTGLAAWTAKVIDVGGGRSTLVDDLLNRGYRNLTVLDISQSAIDQTRERLGERVDSVTCITRDITNATLPENEFDIWHDRAVFHFLTAEEDRRKYIEQVRRSLTKGGHIIVASFGLDGPQKCSGLEVVRYSPDSMHDEFGDSFELLNHVEETHETPFGTTQEFVYCYCRRV